MGYGIRWGGVFSEDVRLLAHGSCRCGQALSYEDISYELAGEVSLARLAEMAVAVSDQLRCLCGALSGRQGQAWACYRLPGSGPWIVAERRLEDERRQVEISVRDRLPRPKNHGNIISELSGIELDVAERLGQPASVRAAWHEAIFALRMGQAESGFPAGAALRCLAVATDQTRDDLSLLDLLDLAEGPRSWLANDILADLERGTISCYVRSDRETLHREILAEVARSPLEAVSTDRRSLVVRQTEGLFSKRLDFGEILLGAVARGRLVALEAGYLMQRAEQRLSDLETVSQEVIDSLGQQPRKISSNEEELLLDLEDRQVHLHLGDYLDAVPSARRQMLEAMK